MCFVAWLCHVWWLPHTVLIMKIHYTLSLLRITLMHQYRHILWKLAAISEAKFVVVTRRTVGGIRGRVYCECACVLYVCTCVCVRGGVRHHDVEGGDGGVRSARWSSAHSRVGRGKKSTYVWLAPQLSTLHCIESLWSQILASRKFRNWS